MLPDSAQTHRQLEHTLRVDLAKPYRRSVIRCLQCSRHPGHGACSDLGVGVEQQNCLALNLGGTQVDRSGEAAVIRHSQAANVREIIPHHGHAAIRGCIVYHDDVGTLRQRRQTPAQ